MARYAGRSGVVYMGATPAGPATLVIGLTNWSYNAATDKIEVTAFGDGNKIYVQGLPDRTGSISGFWDNTETKPFAAGDATAGVPLYLYPSASAPGAYFYGTAWVDPSMETGVGDAVAISFDWAAASTWGRVGI